MRVSSIGEYIKEQREQAKISLRQLASQAGVSNPYLSQIERGVRRPSAEILQQIAKGLRISAEALYVQAGILEDRPPDSGVRAAVLAAPELTERQKQVLLEIYDSFRREAAAQAPEDLEDAAIAAEAAAIQAAAAEATAAEAIAADATAAQAAAEAARAQDAEAAGADGPARGAWKQATSPDGAGLDEEDDDPLAAAEPLGTNEAASPPDSAGLPDGRTRKDE
jgi:transcriptional regulator with XRE-family HTH domain